MQLLEDIIPQLENRLIIDECIDCESSNQAIARIADTPYELPYLIVSARVGKLRHGIRKLMNIHRR